MILEYTGPDKGIAFLDDHRRFFGDILGDHNGAKGAIFL